MRCCSKGLEVKKQMNTECYLAIQRCDDKLFVSAKMYDLIFATNPEHAIKFSCIEDAMDFYNEYLSEDECTTYNIVQVKDSDMKIVKAINY